ncbi:transmembrane protein, putative (DUF247) [Wolffia australiana]
MMVSSHGGEGLPPDELRWVVEIRRCLEEEEEEEDDDGPDVDDAIDDAKQGLVAVSVFRVPATTVAENSSCYAPQLVGLGPYHRWRPELRQTEHWKLSAARRARRRLRARGLRFRHLVDRLAAVERRLRASYHGRLDCSGETLAWAMAVDGCFLLELLHVLAASPGAAGPVCPLVAKPRSRDALLRDLVMLENQVPFWVLRRILEDDRRCPLADWAAELVKELSPFDLVQSDSGSSSHLLEMLYDAIVPRQERPPPPPEPPSEDPDQPSPWFERARAVAAWLCRAAASRPGKLLLEVPRRVLAALPGVAPMALLLEHLLLSEPEEEAGDGPLEAEEIEIPSAAELAGAGVRFTAVRGGPGTVAFDQRTGEFRLPAVRLGATTEAALRNAAAFEAASPAAGAAVVGRYVELMNGIVDAAEDVRVLRRAGVVRNHLKNDGEAAAFWNGLSRSVQLTRVPTLDAAIKDVNAFYRRQWLVRLRKLCQLRHSRLFIPVVVLVFFFFVGFEASCLFGRCSRRQQLA